MLFRKVLKSNQEQAVASWINYLNQVRLDALMKNLQIQNGNLDEALKLINKSWNVIDQEIIQRNRGGLKGMHGFIAEVAECGVGNARQAVVGKMPNYIWINDNGVADMLRDGIPIQQKFSAAGNHLSLQAIKQHLEAYPDFLKDGGKYQIPQEHYDKIKYLLSISEKQANEMPTSNGEFSLKQWKEVNEFFRQGNIPLDDIEPSKLSYKAVQKDAIKDSLKKEKKSLRKTDKEIRKSAYENSKPTIEEGMKATGASAAIEGGVAFVGAIAKKHRNGKYIKDYTVDDWKDILSDTGIGTVKGGIRGITIYTLTNYTATPAAVASSICTASFGIAEQAYLRRSGSITDEQFLWNSEMLCLDASVSALSSFVGQAVIPVPVIGVVIGNTVGTMMYQLAKDSLNKYEKKLLEGYLKELEELDRQLDAKYRKLISELNAGLKQYYLLLDHAFSPDYHEALDGSIALAEHVGVPSEEILRNMADIQKYFLD